MVVEAPFVPEVAATDDPLPEAPGVAAAGVEAVVAGEDATDVLPDGAAAAGVLPTLLEALPEGAAPEGAEALAEGATGFAGALGVAGLAPAPGLAAVAPGLAGLLVSAGLAGEAPLGGAVDAGLSKGFSATTGAGTVSFGARLDEA